MGILRRAFGLPEKEFTTRAAASAAVVPPARTSGRVVNLQNALGLSGIYRGIAILGTSVGQLQLDQFMGNGKRMKPALLIQRPDVDRSRRSFLKRTTVGLAATGNAYWRVFRSPDGRPSSLRVLNPNRVHVGRDRNGRRVFSYADEITGRVEELRPVRDRGRSGDVLHLRLMEVPDLEIGLGPIQACRAAIAGGLDLADYADGWFQKGDVPSGVLSTSQQLTKDDADRYRERWSESMKDRHGVAVLGAGLEYSPVLLKPADAQFLESRQFSITDQARILGIPAPLLLAEINGSAMTYQNMEHVDLQLMKHTVMDYLNVIEDAFSELLPVGQTAAFRPFDALRSDNKTRAEINQIYVTMGAKSLEQVAEEESFVLPAKSSEPAGSEQDQDQDQDEGANA